ncbi:hypothetical protein NL676_021830 [Syzygium grande]|nr:hypothetical protein NL676_021830 [Syzygium grande]
MATKTMTVLAFVLLLQYASCYAQIDQVTLQGQRLSRFGGGECWIERLDMLELSRRIEAEAGVSKLWDEDEDQLQCAGVAVVRHIIRQRGLFLPAFTNAPELLYVVQVQDGGQMRGERTQDRHQKVRQILEGNILAMPARATHWIYNQGQSDLVIVSIVDLGNQENQLDQSFRKFFPAGDPQQGRQQSGSTASKRASATSSAALTSKSSASPSPSTPIELAQELKCPDDQQGHIVEVQNELQITTPRYREGEQEGESEWERERAEERRERDERQWLGGDALHHEDPRGGRFTALNSFSLPIPSFIGLSAERAVLYRDALVAPRYYMNCHGVIYLSVIRSLPEEVVMNSYDILREEARRLKYAREEFAVLSPGSMSSQRGMED